MNPEELKAFDRIWYYGTPYHVRKNDLETKVICLLGRFGQRCIRHKDFKPEKAELRK
jgi:hypothetical protein